MKSNKLQRAVILASGMLFLAAGPEAGADVAPPVEIRMSLDELHQAVSDEEYAGTFEVHVHRAGTLANFKLLGDGWKLLSLEIPGDPVTVQPGVIRIPFGAVPADADEPIGLSLTYNGRRVAKAAPVGPAHFAQIGKPYRLTQVPGASVLTAYELERSLRKDPNESPPETQPDAQGAHQFQFVGRIVYSRPCRDMPDPCGILNGNCDDPWDMPASTIGLDHIDVRILDNDTVGSEEMWSGYTDENGYFDTQQFTWEGSVGDPDPDLILYCETEVDGVVDVTDNSWEEYTYTFQTGEIENFDGGFHDFGWYFPAPTSHHPALHIFNSVVRTYRYIQEKPTYTMPEVQVEWPDDSEDGGAWYERSSTEIHMSTEQQWHNETVSHEYGHHFITSTYDPDPPEPDYCNGICDDDYENEDCGHCIWCQETDHDAWNEGFPNWLADVVTRDYPVRYTQEPSGVPFVPLYTLSLESLKRCDGIYDHRLLTEGFVGALLRDIEDQTQDDHNSDEVFDMMCLGPVEIFHVTYLDQPITVLEFIDAFLARYPEYTDLFWPTAHNVGDDAYTSGFPADTQPPGVVPSCNSPTHPLGTGGSLPCITFEWWPAPDDAHGVSAYSFLCTTDPAGEEPDEFSNPIWPTDTCTVAGKVEVWELGEHYFCIKAQDNAGNWSSQWRKFGPFEIIDCNGSGILDVCDIDCEHEGKAEICLIGNSPCPEQPGCGGGAEDCQPNLIPDECDIASGNSEDCNLNGVPDECENMFHWDGTSGFWNQAGNWLEGTTPTLLSEVCIDVDGDQTVTYSSDVVQVGTLACSENFSIAAVAPPWPELVLADGSWVTGNLQLTGGNAVLNVVDRLDIAGLFTWADGSTLRGLGETHANGGVNTSDIVYLEDHHLILDGNSTSVGTARVEFVGDSTFEIKPGSTYEHQGGQYFLNGWSDNNFINGGTLIKSVDPGASSIRMFSNNSGLIHVQTGTLQFYQYGTSSGDFLADPGATLQFVDGGFNFLGSSSVVADNVIFGAGSGGWNSISGAWNVTGTTTVSKGQVTFTDEANIISYGASFYIPRGIVNFNAIIDGPIQFDILSIGPGATSDGIANFNSGDPVQVTNLILGPGGIQSLGAITLNGLTTWNAGGDFGGTGTVNANGDVLIGPSGDQKTLSNCTFNNAATATFLSGINRSSAVFNNLATGVMDIQADVGVFNNSFSDPFNNAGIMVKSAGTGTATIRAAATNTGTVEVQSGELSFTGSYGGSYTQTAGRTVLNGGDLLMTGPAPLQISGGLLTGTGTITGNVVNSAGTTEPGLSVGTLQVDGNYTQAAAAALTIEIGGGPACSAFDQLLIAGTATLAGTLNIQVIDGCQPALDDTFIVLTSGQPLSGAFADINGPALPNGLGFIPVYNTNDVTLQVVPCVPPDWNCNDCVELIDFATFAAHWQQIGCTPTDRCGGADLIHDGTVNLVDFSEFAAHWLEGCL